MPRSSSSSHSSRQRHMSSRHSAHENTTKPAAARRGEREPSSRNTKNGKKEKYSLRAARFGGEASNRQQPLSKARMKSGQGSSFLKKSEMKKKDNSSSSSRQSRRSDKEKESIIIKGTLKKLSQTNNACVWENKTDPTDPTEPTSPNSSFSSNSFDAGSLFGAMDEVDEDEAIDNFLAKFAEPVGATASEIDELNQMIQKAAEFAETKKPKTMEEMGEILQMARREGVPAQLVAQMFQETFQNVISEAGGVVDRGVTTSSIEHGSQSARLSSDSFDAASLKLKSFGTIESFNEDEAIDNYLAKFDAPEGATISEINKLNFYVKRTAELARKEDPSMEEMGEILQLARREGVPVEVVTQIFKETYQKVIAEAGIKDKSITIDPSTSHDTASFQVKSFGSIESFNEDDSIDEYLTKISPPEGSTTQELNQLNLYIEKATRLMKGNPSMNDMGEIFRTARQQGVPINIMSEVFKEVVQKEGITVCSILSRKKVVASFSDSMSDDKFVDIKGNISEMDEVDDNERIDAFLKRIYYLRKGGHFVDVNVRDIDIPNVSSRDDDNNTEAIEVDAEYGFVNKKLNDEELFTEEIKLLHFFVGKAMILAKRVNPSIDDMGNIFQSATQKGIPSQIISLIFKDAIQRAAIEIGAIETKKSLESEKSSLVMQRTFSTMEDFDDSEEIMAFLNRFYQLKAGGHFPDANGKDMINSEYIDECDNDDVEIDAMYGFVRKDLASSENSLKKCINMNTNSWEFHDAKEASKSKEDLMVKRTGIINIREQVSSKKEENKLDEKTRNNSATNTQVKSESYSHVTNQKPAILSRKMNTEAIKKEYETSSDGLKYAEQMLTYIKKSLCILRQLSPSIKESDIYQGASKKGVTSEMIRKIKKAMYGQVDNGVHCIHHDLSYSTSSMLSWANSLEQSPFSFDKEYDTYGAYNSQNRFPDAYKNTVSMEQMSSREDSSSQSSSFLYSENEDTLLTLTNDSTLSTDCQDRFQTTKEIANIDNLIYGRDKIYIENNEFSDVSNDKGVNNGAIIVPNMLTKCYHFATRLDPFLKHVEKSLDPYLDVVEKNFSFVMPPTIDEEDNSLLQTQSLIESLNGDEFSQESRNECSTTESRNECSTTESFDVSYDSYRSTSEESIDNFGLLLDKMDFVEMISILTCSEGKQLSAVDATAKMKANRFRRVRQHCFFNKRSQKSLKKHWHRKLYRNNHPDKDLLKEATMVDLKSSWYKNLPWEQRDFNQYFQNRKSAGLVPYWFGDLTKVNGNVEKFFRTPQPFFHSDSMKIPVYKIINDFCNACQVKTKLKIGRLSLPKPSLGKLQCKLGHFVTRNSSDQSLVARLIDSSSKNGRAKASNRDEVKEVPLLTNLPTTSDQMGEAQIQETLSLHSTENIEKHVENKVQYVPLLTYSSDSLETSGWKNHTENIITEIPSSASSKPVAPEERDDVSLGKCQFVSKTCSSSRSSEGKRDGVASLQNSTPDSICAVVDHRKTPKGILSPLFRNKPGETKKKKKKYRLIPRKVQ